MVFVNNGKNCHKNIYNLIYYGILYYIDMVKIKSFKKKLSEIDKKRAEKNIDKGPKVLQKLDRIFNNANVNKIESKEEEEMYNEMANMEEDFNNVFKRPVYQKKAIAMIKKELIKSKAKRENFNKKFKPEYKLKLIKKKKKLKPKKLKLSRSEIYKIKRVRQIKERQKEVVNIRYGEIICTLSNIIILICLCIFVYITHNEIDKNNSQLFIWSMRIFTLFIVMSFIGYFFKYKDLVKKVRNSFSKWESKSTFDFQFQFYISLILLVALHFWRFIIDGKYDDYFENKYPIYVITAIIMIIIAINISLSIFNFTSQSGSAVTDMKDTLFKNIGLEWMTSDSIELNPLDKAIDSIEQTNV